eukprot:NODE_30_length_4203_cov_19.513984.p1 GENE.NODE_30_length_4203_cov_19.513984~~NODE_30_length_4203_cov_19.513984.p1  ORF type:complete len:997 (+),score=321.63 NODE_30_length_4203_cov_19.513984:88-3078(+)
MDFDDLDDAIEQRIQEDGCLTGAAAALMNPAMNLKDYVPKDFMPPMENNTQFPSIAGMPVKGKPVDRNVCIRVFFFYGAGGSVADHAATIYSAPSWMELHAYEWPAHGTRADEAPAANMEALVADAFIGISPILKQHAADGELEGAPFALIGHGEGAALMTLLAPRLRWEAGVEPKAVVVLDRAPPHVPLLNAAGIEALRTQPHEFLRSYNRGACKTADMYRVNIGEAAAQKLLQTWQDDLTLTSAPTEAGFHSYVCPVLVAAARSGKLDQRAKQASAYSGLVLRIGDTGDTLTVPVKKTTKLDEVKALVAQGARVSATSITFTELSKDEVSVEGISSFRRAPHKWPHPLAVIGAGYNAIKTCMEYLRCGNDNIICFDRFDKPGGYCWVTAANRDSKLQTEFGAFHVWWGPEYIGGPIGDWPKEWSTWASKVEVLKHFHHAAEKSGMLAHTHLQCNVSKLDIIGDLEKHDHYYNLTVDSLSGGPTKVVAASVLYNYPGSMTQLRPLEYPGEKDFGGQIGYGMCDDFTYDERLKDKRVAILGNGAFAIENVRTCCEHAVAKVFMVTRRKNMPSPRVPCWLVHQGPVPTPARLVIKAFGPMYSLCGMGDAWDYDAVRAGADRMNVNIVQNSRFGIGDVTFLAHAYGILEYVVDTLERVSPQTLHLTSGATLENITSIIKSLGLVGDFNVDKFHNMTEMIGLWCGGDWRRVIAVDPLGMNAANFTTFATGDATHGNVHTLKFLHDFPEEYYRIEALGIKAQLPRSKQDPSCQRPAYVTDVKYAMLSGITIGGFLPLLEPHLAQKNTYWHALYHTIHPTDKFLAEAIADWDKYQKLFKEHGREHDYVQYPYDKQFIADYCAEYSKQVVPISHNGPGEEATAAVLANCHTDHERGYRAMFTSLVAEGLHTGCRVLSQLHIPAVEVLPLLQECNGRKNWIASSADTSMEFDLGSYAEWDSWTTCGATVVEFAEAEHHTMVTDSKVWDMVFTHIRLKRASEPE